MPIVDIPVPLHLAHFTTLPWSPFIALPPIISIKLILFKYLILVYFHFKSTYYLTKIDFTDSFNYNFLTDTQPLKNTISYDIWLFNISKILTTPRRSNPSRNKKNYFLIAINSKNMRGNTIVETQNRLNKRLRNG
jgi:hypothetical protein